jgi:HK97 family phage prohead protease
MTDFITKSFKWDDKFVPAVDMKARTVSGYITRPEVDRDGEIVMPGAFERHIEVYKSNPILLESHQHKTRPIGKAIDLEFRPDGVWAKFQLAKTQTGDEVLTLFKEGCLRGFSSGFVPVMIEENPSLNKIPPDALKTANGKRVKKLYHEVELVEVSALAIPSNRRALVDNVAKGNSTAGLVIKMFDAFDNKDQVNLIIKEWIEEKEKESFVDDFITKEIGLLATQYAPQVWNSATAYGGTSNVTVVTPEQKKLDELLKNQETILASLNQVKDKDSWGEWAKTWGLRLGGAAAGYLFLTRTNMGQGMVQAAKDHVKDWIINSLRPSGRTLTTVKGPDTEVTSVTDALDILNLAIDKAKEVGADKTKEFKAVISKYNEITDELKNLVESKSFDDFFVKDFGFESFVTKAMTAEQFEEQEHPRHGDGKFRKSSEAKTIPKPKEVTPVVTEHKENSTVIQKKDRAVQLTEKQINRVKEWALQNKGKVVLSGITVAFAPLLFATARYGGKLTRIVYSDISKRAIPWDKVSPEVRNAWRSQVQPGDIYLSGGKPHANLEEVFSDVSGTIKGLFNGDSSAQTRLAETLGKAFNGSSYLHSRLIVGTYDKTLHDRVMQIFLHGRGPSQSVAERMLMSTLDKYGSKESFVKKFMNRKKYFDNKKYIDEVLEGHDVKDISAFIEENRKKIGDLKFKTNKQKKVFWDDIKEKYEYNRVMDDIIKGEGKIKDSFGKIVVASPQPGKGKKATIGLWISDDPMPGKDAIAAILRPKESAVSLEVRKKMASDIIDDTFSLKSSGIEFQNRGGRNKDVADILKERPDLIVSRVGDPVTNRMISARFKNDKVLCSGAIAEMYKKYTGYDLKNTHLLWPGDLLKRPDFAEMLLEPGQEWRNISFGAEKMRTLPKIKLAAVGTIGGVTAAKKIRKTDQEKSFTDFVSKAMTEQDFDPQEHPRAPSGSEHGGEFVKAGTGTTQTKSKTTHGGSRTGAGRIPNDAHKAVAVMKEKYKEQFPDLTDTKINEKIRADAYRLGKPDWILYLDDPAKYHEELLQKQLAAMQSKYRKPSTRSGFMSDSLNNASEASSMMAQNLKQYDEDVVKSKAISQAWNVYKDENAEKDEKTKAKTILAVGGLASAAVLMGLFWKRPTYIARSLSFMKDPKAAEAMEVAGQKWAVQVAELAGGIPKTGVVADADILQLVKVTGMDSWTTAKQANFVKRWIGGAIARINGEYQKGETYAIRFGPGWHGYTSESMFYPGQGFVFKTSEAIMTNPRKGKQAVGGILQYHSRAFDTDVATGFTITNDKGGLDPTGYINSARIRLKNLTDPKNTPNPEKVKKYETKLNALESEIKSYTSPFYVDNTGGADNLVIARKKMVIDDITYKNFVKDNKKAGIKLTDKMIDDAVEKNLLNVKQADETDMIKWLHDNKYMESVKEEGVLKLINRNGTIPENIFQKYTPEEHTEWAKNAEMEDWWGWKKYLNKEVIGPFSRKTVAGLTVATGAAAAPLYYFNKDISGFADDMVSHQTKQRKEMEEINRQSAKTIPSTGSKSLTYAQMMALERAKQKTAGKNKELEAVRMLRDRTQKDLISAAIGEKVRREIEGSVVRYATILATVLKRHPDMATEILNKTGFNWNNANEITDLAVMMGKDEEFAKWFAGRAAVYMQEKKNKQKVFNTFTKMSPNEGEYEDFKRAAEEMEREKAGAKSFDDFVTKGMSDSDTGKTIIELNSLSDILAYDFINQMSDCSDVCKMAIENAMPGHTAYENILSVLNDIYKDMRDGARQDIKGITKKSIDTNYLSASNDQAAGLFVGQINEICPKCKRKVTEDMISKCQNSECPYTYLDKIVGEPKLKQKRNKEETSGKKEK